MYRTNQEVAKVNRYFLENKKSFNKGIGASIKKIRCEKKIVIEDMAERSIITPLYISHIEKGLYSISLLKFICLCNSLEVTPNEILEEFLFGCKYNDDILYKRLQAGKNISENILDFMREKK